GDGNAIAPDPGRPARVDRRHRRIDVHAVTRNDSRASMTTRRLLSKRSKVPSTTASKRHRENVLTRKLRARYRLVTPRSNLRHTTDIGKDTCVRGGPMKFRNPRL